MGDRNSSLPSTSHVLSQQMRHTGRCVSSSPLELECIFPLDQTGGSACGCVLIAPFGSSFCAVSRVGVTPWVNRGGLYPSCVHASTVTETSGVSSPPFDTEIKGQERRRDIAETPKNPAATKKSALLPSACQQSDPFPASIQLGYSPWSSSLRPPPCLCAPRRALILNS